VKVSNGEVTISGMVVERLSKRLAEDVAEGVMGVKQVHNQIRVQHEAQTRDTGAGTRKAAAGETGQQHEFTGSSRR
jgi:BON domain